MAFNISYKGLTDHNIKYIYSDRAVQFTFPRKSHFRPLKEEIPLPPLKRYPVRFYEYYDRYNIGIPRAPAFRGTDSDHIERIVRRICKPIECQKRRRKDIVWEDETDGDHKARKEEDREDDGKTGTRGSYERSDGASTQRSDASRPRKALEISALVARLQKPTESSRRKQYEQRKEEDKKEGHWGKFSPLPPIEN